MRRIVCALAVIILAGQPAAACTFCGGALASRQTLREHFHRAKYVAHGRLANPRFDPDGGTGSTDLHVGKVLKPDAAAGNRPVVVLPRYLPVIGDTPPDYLVFCDTATGGRLDPLHGLPATAAVVEYLLGAAKLDEKDAATRLGYFFRHLDSPDPAIAADAFLEFGKAPDAEIIKARAVLDPAKVRKLLADPDTPAERLGVFAMMLGLCGGRADADWLAATARTDPLPERVRENLGGYLAGLTLLDPAAGWAATEAVLTDPKRPFDQRLTAIGTVRFFQATREAESKPHVLRCYRGLLAQGDLADMAAEDLRRWGWWDLTAEVLRHFDAPTHAAPVVRRGIVRYALQCPAEEAKRFIAAVRQKEPELVRKVEETLKLYEPVKR
jgi:hypothetical protein